MSRSFAGVPFSSYIGTPYSLGLPLFGPAARWVPFMFDWNTYGASTAKPNVGVNCDVSGLPVGTNLGVIRSVRVDNTGNAVPVYVYFPDTQYVVVAPPNTIVNDYVVTTLLKCQVIAEGFTSGQVGATTVYIANVILPSLFDPEIAQSVSLWRASANVSRGGNILNTNFGIPALGDQSCTPQINNPLVNGKSDPLFLDSFNHPIAANFFYITTLQLSISGMTGGGGSISLGIIDNPITQGTIWEWAWDNTIAGTVLFPVVSGLNLKLSGATQWNLEIFATTFGQGNIFLSCGFSTNPT